MGSKFEINKSNMKVVSIDGSRLELRNQIIPETGIEYMEFVAPAKMLNDLNKILKEDEKIVNISLKGIKSETMLHALEEKDIYEDIDDGLNVSGYNKVYEKKVSYGYSVTNYFLLEMKMEN